MAVFDEKVIAEAVKTGISANSLIEVMIKLLTLPYLLAGFTASAVAELRELEIIGKKTYVEDYQDIA